jgi:hypothetical protein
MYTLGVWMMIKANHSMLKHAYLRYKKHHQQCVAVGSKKNYDAFKPYLDNLPFRVDCFFEDISKINTELLENSNMFCFVEDVCAEIVEKLRAMSPQSHVYTFDSVRGHILMCNFKGFVDRFYLNSVSDEILKELFLGKEKSKLCVWGYGGYGTDFVLRLDKLGIQYTVTDMDVKKQGQGFTNGNLIERWADIKNQVDTVIVAVEGNCANIASLLDPEVTVFAVNG